MKQIKILLTDDHTLIREVWGHILNSHSKFNVIAECANGEEAIEKTRNLLPDIVLMDINLPGISGIETVLQIQKNSPATKILCISMHTHPSYVRKMMRLGAMGYVTKNSPREEMFKAITEIHEGRKYICNEIKNILSDNMVNDLDSTNSISSLSDRELEIMGYVKKGLSSKEVASQLLITVKTVEVHRHNILKKLDLRNTPALVNFINNNPELEI